PNDEPASVLLEKIRQEKERLIKEKKIKRDKNASIIYRGEDNSYYEKFADGTVKCIDDEIPFEIPATWEWCRIKHLFVTSSGSTPQSKNPLYYSNGTINWVRTTDLNNGILDSCEIQITPKAVLDYNLSIIPQESICIAMYGGGGTIGKHSIIRFDTTINQSVCAIHPNFMCNMEYVHIFMQYQRPFWMDYAAGSRKDPNINQIIIKNCLIPIPPKKEQDKIVSKYNTLFPLIDNYSEANEQRDKLNEDIASTLKKSILQEAIQGRLVPQCASEEPASILLQRIRDEKQRLVKEGKLKKKDVVDSVICKGDDNKYYEQVGKQCEDITEEIPFDLPDSWAWTRLSTIVIMTIGKTPPRGVQSFWADGIYPWVSISDMSEGGIINKTKEKVSEYAASNVFSAISPKGSLLMSFKLTVGRTSILGIDAYHNEAIITILPYMDNNNIMKMYLLKLLPILSTHGDSKDAIKGKTLNSKSLAKLLVPLPPIKEQQRIVAQIEKLFEKLK
ncbi:MAG: restriction endonuclease subunit S, partial [bacterium]|nr:restriction endonuclease subunit S [bacterium]